MKRVVFGFFIILAACGLGFLFGVMLFGTSEKTVYIFEKNDETEKAGEGVLRKFIFIYDEERDVIREVLYENWDMNEEHMTLLTIPGETGYMLSKDRYNSLRVAYPEISGFIRVRQLNKLFGSQPVYELEAQVLSELIGIPTDIYSVIGTGQADELFYRDSSGVLRLKNETIRFFNSCNEQTLEEWLTDGVDIIAGNDTLLDRVGRISDYMAISNLKISCDILPGEYTNDGYVPEANNEGEGYESIKE